MSVPVIMLMFSVSTLISVSRLKKIQIFTHTKYLYYVCDSLLTFIGCAIKLDIPIIKPRMPCNDTSTQVNSCFEPKFFLACDYDLNRLLYTNFFTVVVHFGFSDTE